jgi:hypothetical protein
MPQEEEEEEEEEEEVEFSVLLVCGIRLLSSSLAIVY